MLVLEGLIGLHRSVQLQLLQSYWSGHRLGFHDIEWFALETNRDHSVIFETASKYCILDSFVDSDGYSISSEGFLLVVTFLPRSQCLLISWLQSPSAVILEPSLFPVSHCFHCFPIYLP